MGCVAGVRRRTLRRRTLCRPMGGLPPAATPPLLRHVMLLARDVPAAAAFYSRALGLPLTTLTERWAELDAGGGGVLAVKADDGAPGGGGASASSRSPFLCFSVGDLQSVVARCLAAGAALDGPIQYPPRGAVRGGEGGGNEGCGKRRRRRPAPSLPLSSSGGRPARAGRAPAVPV